MRELFGLSEPESMAYTVTVVKPNSLTKIDWLVSGVSGPVIDSNKLRSDEMDPENRFGASSPVAKMHFYA